MNADKFLEKLNISKSDYEHIKRKMKREPNELELWLFSAMYSEHCAYRHSKKYLEKLPKKNAVFAQENAGGIKIGRHAVLFKMESHNHPSAVEPYNGAATGIGGIIRDVLAMNARPVALADSLKFGKLENNKTKYIFEGVVNGIADYGNCIGVPTITGECDFDEAYTDNPLVNVMALGVAEIKKIKTSKAAPDMVIILLGSATMKDGIGGASFASKDLDNGQKENRISVQIADPLMEKKLIEATLQILDRDLAKGCQDCGAAGILSSTSEMAYKGNCGIELYLDKIHTAQRDMKPFEIMLSETQERMMFCTEVKNISKIKEISKKYEIPCSVIGKTIKERYYRLFWAEKEIAAIKTEILCNAPFKKVFPKKSQTPFQKPFDETADEKRITELIKDPSFACKDWIYSQYDYTVGARTAILPKDKGIGAIWLFEENCFIGLTTESKPAQVSIDPYNGTLNTVFDAAGKLIAAGFEPLGITNCLNFANPTRPQTMYQFTQSLKGMGKALKKLKIPVCSGNVSFYNQTEDYLVYPTPVIGMIGMCKEGEKIISNKLFLSDTVIVIGKSDNIKTDFKEEKKLKKFLVKANERDLLNSCLRITKGGIFGALFKGLAPSFSGFKFAQKMTGKELFFEYQGRYLTGVSDIERVINLLKKEKIQYQILGKVIEKDIYLNDFTLDSEKLFSIYNNSITEFMN